MLEGQPPSPDELARHLGPETLVAIQWVNHETGTILPIHRIRGGLPRASGATVRRRDPGPGQAADRRQLARGGRRRPWRSENRRTGGAGACWIRRGLDLEPVLEGGSQERGRWPGTPDTLSMVGFGAACRLTRKRLAQQSRVTALRDRHRGVPPRAGRRPERRPPSDRHRLQPQLSPAGRVRCWSRRSTSRASAFRPAPPVRPACRSHPPSFARCIRMSSGALAPRFESV